ncbi:rho GTPase-activating protein 22 isoform X3 [Onychomys torridus]|uniref:rho GTPase-activating protein 22 isoform X3 n=1 Tax=Onychomys torridus TaxID=38674 RepID=UPI00167FCF10|nr:rho GTPase-activating protein 22 isoform X3 [Onychomys torridus]
MLSPKIRQARRARSKSLVMGEQNRSPGRPLAPNKLGPVLKAGWLRKQRSIMKNWQQRWFVLRGDQLFYYKDKDESKPQGFISLQGTQVTELLPDPEDPGKHLFEITPGGAGEREKVPANPEALLLMASSQRDMEDWVQAIRRVIWAPLGGGIFGQRLEDTVHHERKYGPRLAPLLVEQCVDFIRERGLSEEGLFRMPGQANLVRDLQDSFDCGEKPLFDRSPFCPSTTDVHTVASLLKLYLRELPEPVIPFARYEDFLSCAQLLTKDEGEGTLELAKQVSNLPQANYNLLRYICRFLDEVQAHSNVNKMSVQNLATVFGPNILRPQIEDPVTIMEGTSLVQHLMTVLIRKHGQLFTATSLEEPALPRATAQSTVEWGSEEVTRDHQGEPGSPGLPTHRTSSLDGPAAAVLSRTSPPRLGSQTGPAATSPGKRMHTLPGWKSSFRQGSRSESPKGGGSSLEVPIISSGGNWLINGLSSLRGHRRASSGDRLKDAGSVQRLSTYDNVPPSSHFPSTASMASMVWSAASSSREASVSSCTACRASDSSACSSLHTEWALEPSPLPSSSEDHKSPDLGHSLDEACAGSGSSEPSDPGSPPHAHVRRCRALQGQVAALRAELCQQRIEYERNLQSIEEGSADLRKQMSRLEEELDQEKKKYAMLEIKLRNSERAREDAERRNQLLQREMEEFFATLGSLTVGTKGARAPE